MVLANTAISAACMVGVPVVIRTMIAWGEFMKYYQVGAALDRWWKSHPR
jgi:hypothetical protein